MVEYMEKVAHLGEFDYVLKEQEDMVNDPLWRKRIYHGKKDLFDGCDDAHTTPPSSSTADELIKKLSQLKEEFESYCKQMTCLSFKSSKYDMNLVKSHLAKHLQMEKKYVFTIKGNNQYACLANLAISNF